MRERIRYRYRFYGQVQGVGFRYTAVHAAERYGITGWVKNEYDGSVTAEAQGTREELSEWLRLLSDARYIRIEHIESVVISALADERGFSVAS